VINKRLLIFIFKYAGKYFNKNEKKQDDDLKDAS
jgi:hypothetical protein